MCIGVFIKIVLRNYSVKLQRRTFAENYSAIAEIQEHAAKRLFRIFDKFLFYLDTMCLYSLYK